jgi:hypothetical protein
VGSGESEGEGEGEGEVSEGKLAGSLGNNFAPRCCFRMVHSFVISGRGKEKCLR